MEEKLKRYVLGTFRDPGLRILPLGEHRRAILLEREKGPYLVIKALTSQGKWNRYAWASGFMREQGIPVPEMPLPPYSSPREDLFLVFERPVPGTPLAKTRPDRELLAEVVAKVKAIHSIEGDRWGVPTKKMKKRGYYKRHLKKIEGWCKGDPAIWNEIQTRKWVKRVVHKLDKEEKRFQLTHGDLHGKNILVGPEGVYFVDLVRSGFGSYAKDLARLDMWERIEWGTQNMFDLYMEELEDPLLEDKLKLFYLGELVRRRDKKGWVRELLWKLLEKEELPF